MVNIFLMVYFDRNLKIFVYKPDPIQGLGQLRSLNPFIPERNKR